MINLERQFNLTDVENDVFKTLVSFGDLEVSDISRRCGIKRTTCYGILQKLKDKKLIEEIYKNSVKTFGVSSKEEIIRNIDTRIIELEKSKKDFIDIISNTPKNSSAEPKIKFYKGKDGVQFVLNELILKRNIETESFWPIQNMLEVLGDEYFKNLNKERIKKYIYTRAIWPKNQIVDTKKYPYLSGGEDFLREIRIAPKQIDFSLGYWIYENSVVFISSKKEMYAFIVESQEFVDMLKIQWELIWNISTPLKKEKNNKEAVKFLKEIS